MNLIFLQKKYSVDKENNIIIGKGDQLIVIDKEGRTIKANLKK